jgi:hypothetical protein
MSTPTPYLDPEDIASARRAVIEQVQRNLKIFRDVDLEKWRNETGSRTLKNVIDAELERRYWNGRSDIVPRTLE